MLPQALEQFRSSFHAMPVHSRVIAVLLVAAMVMALGVLIRGSSTSQTEYLLGGKLLDDNDLDAAEMAFGSAHLTGWERDGRRMLIPTAQRSEFLEALKESAALPTSLRSHIQAAIDSSTPFESSEQRSARVSHAKERDLSDYIAQFPDIRSASVTYDEGERIGLGRGRKQSASVFVQPEGLEPISPARVQAIRKMIKAAFAGMVIEDVEVTDANALSLTGVLDSDDPLSKKRREEEAYYEQKIRSQLAGYGEIRVKTFADIDPSMGVEKASVKYESQPSKQIRTRRKVEIVSPQAASRGGIGAQISALITSNRSVKIEPPIPSSTTQVDETSTEQLAGQQYEATRTAALTVKRIRVSIGLPASYYRQVHRQNLAQKHPGRSPAEQDVLTDDQFQSLRNSTKLAIQSAVLPLLPDVADGEDAASLVEVWDYPDLPERSVATAATSQAALRWVADSWQTIATLSLAAIALLTVRAAIQSRTTQSATAGESPITPGLALDTATSRERPLAESPRRAEPQTLHSDPLRSELIAGVERDPALAASVLQGWIAEAA